MPISVLRSLLFAGMTAGILLQPSCSKPGDDPDPPAPLPPVGDIVLAGNSYPYTQTSTPAFYWKKDSITRLSPEKHFVNAWGMVASGADIYIAGDTSAPGSGQRAVYWKNGQLIALINNTSGAKGIAVSGSDVYVVGWAYDASVNLHRAAIWKNGVLSFLKSPVSTALFCDAYAVFVSGTNVWVAGSIEQNGVQSAIYWKNNEPVVLPGIAAGLHGLARSIFVSGNNVYTAGYVINASTLTMAAYWKNGTLVILDNTSSVATGIILSGNDVHIAGRSMSQGGATYWKNGTIVPLGNIKSGSFPSEGNCIALSGTDVYVGGSNHDTASFWKNGVETKIPTAKWVWAMAVAH